MWLASAGGQETKKLWLIRKDEEAVSPVIATILLVAITLVLVSTLFVMVSSLLPGSSAGEDSVDIAMTDYQDGNWTLIVRRTDGPSVPASSVRLTIYDWSGVIKLNRVLLSDLTLSNMPTYKAVYHGVPGAGLSVGDTISIFKKAEHLPLPGVHWPAGGYEPGYSYSLTASSALLATGTL